MVFESIRKSYTVLNLIEKSRDLDTFLCRSGDETCLLIRLKSDLIKKSTCPVLIDMYDDAGFNDIIEIFTYQSDIIAVFKYSGPVSGFDDACENGSFTYEKKLKMLYDVISELCVCDIPVCLAEDMLKNSNIGYKNDSTIGFCCILKTPENYGSRNMETFAAALAEKTKKLFKEEIESNMANDILQFCDDVCENNPNSYLELFERYKSLYDTLEKKLKDGTMIPETRSIKIWKTIKKLIPVLKALLTLLVIISALFLLISSLIPKGSDESGSFRNIGTVIIEEYSITE